MMTSDQHRAAADAAKTLREMSARLSGETEPRMPGGCLVAIGFIIGAAMAVAIMAIGFLL